jgi:hypothetical protein
VRLFASCSFHESFSPKFLKKTLGSFRFLSEICGDICKSGAPLVSTTTVANLPPVRATLAVNFPMVLLANLTQVLTTPAVPVENLPPESELEEKNISIC